MSILNNSLRARRELLLLIAFGFAPFKMAQSQSTPLRVDVVPLSQGAEAGSQIPVKIVLLGADGKPSQAKENTTVNFSVEKPSGKIDAQQLQIPSGHDSQNATIKIDETGLSKLQVQQQNNELLGSSNYVLTTPATASSSSRRKTKSKKSASRERSELQDEGAIRNPLLLDAAFTSRYSETANAQGDGRGGDDPHLILAVSGQDGDDGYPADGTNFARIQIYYVGQSLKHPEIKVWFGWTNGDIQGNPFVLPKNSPIVEAHWTSHFPVDSARLRVQATAPKYSIEYPNEDASGIKVRFGEPVYGIGLVNPPDSMSIVDRLDLVARFVGASGRPDQNRREKAFKIRF